MKYTCWAIPSLSKSTNWTFTLRWINSADSNCLTSQDSGLQLTLVCTKEPWTMAFVRINKPAGGLACNMSNIKTNWIRSVIYVSSKKITNNVHCLFKWKAREGCFEDRETVKYHIYDFFSWCTLLKMGSSPKFSWPAPLRPGHRF